eukprot:gene12298-15454_t
MRSYSVIIFCYIAVLPGPTFTSTFLRLLHFSVQGANLIRSLTPLPTPMCPPPQVACHPSQLPPLSPRPPICPPAAPPSPLPPAVSCPPSCPPSPLPPAVSLPPKLPPAAPLPRCPRCLLPPKLLQASVTTSMADELAPPSKLACFFRTLLCARASVAVSRKSQALSPAATVASAARSQTSDPKWSNIVVNQSYAADKDTVEECPTSLSPGAMSVDVYDYRDPPCSPAYTRSSTCRSMVHQGRPELGRGAGLSSQNSIRVTSCGDYTFSRLSKGLQVARGNGLDVQNSSSVLSLDSSPAYRRAVTCRSMVHLGRPELGQGAGVRSQNSIQVKSCSDCTFSQISKGQQVARGNCLDVQNSSPVLSLDSSPTCSPAYRRASTCHSFAQQGRPELGQGAGVRSQNSIRVHSCSDSTFSQLSIRAVDTSMHGAVDTSMRSVVDTSMRIAVDTVMRSAVNISMLGTVNTSMCSAVDTIMRSAVNMSMPGTVNPSMRSAADISTPGSVDTSMRGSRALSSHDSCPHPQPWQRKSTLIPRLQSGRVGRYLELLKRNSSASGAAGVKAGELLTMLIGCPSQLGAHAMSAQDNWVPMPCVPKPTGCPCISGAQANWVHMPCVPKPTGCPCISGAQANWVPMHIGCPSQLGAHAYRVPKPTGCPCIYGAQANWVPMPIGCPSQLGAHAHRVLKPTGCPGPSGAQVNCVPERISIVVFSSSEVEVQIL